jgi:hypothetical protein
VCNRSSMAIAELSCCPAIVNGKAKRSANHMNIKGNASKAAAAALAALFLAAPIARAQVATTLEQAELAGLSPEKRAEVQARAVNGNTVSEVLQTMLLNNIKGKHPASRIVALDFGRGVAVVRAANGGMHLVNFDTTTLAIRG